MPPNEELPHRKQKRKKGMDDTFCKVNLKKDRIEEETDESENSNLYEYPCDTIKEKIIEDDNSIVAQSENKETKLSTNEEKDTTPNFSTTNENEEKKSTTNKSKNKPEMDDAASDILEYDSESAEIDVSTKSKSETSTTNSENKNISFLDNDVIINEKFLSESLNEMSGSENKVENLTIDQKQKKR